MKKRIVVDQNEQHWLPSSFACTRSGQLLMLVFVLIHPKKPNMAKVKYLSIKITIAHISQTSQTSQPIKY